MGIEHHLLCLAWIGADEQHARVAEPDMGDLDLHGHAVDQHDLVAPVELVGLPRREGAAHRRRPTQSRAFSLPCPSIAAHRVVTALIAQTAQRLEDAHQGQAFARACLRCQQQPVEIRPPLPQLRQRLDLPLVAERRAPDRTTLRTVFRDTCRSRTISLIERPRMKNSRLMRAIVSTPNIPPPPSIRKDRQSPAQKGGSKLNADPPAQGSKLHADHREPRAW